MLLILVVGVPLAGTLLCLLAAPRHARVVNLVTNAAVLVLTALAAAAAAREGEGYRLVTDLDWIPAFGIRFHLGADGISTSLLLLTAVVSFAGAIASWRVEQSPRGYHALYLLLLTGMLGVFVSLDLFLFYVFWEVMLLPMYFLIGIWGGPRRQYAAIKFFLYTLFGSVLLLAGLILVYLHHVTWQIDELARIARETGGLLGGVGALAKGAFVAVFIGFAVKIPSFPFHTWLPDAHVEAPTPISMILAGVLLKMGGYGLIRVAYPFFPEAAVWAGGVISAISLVAIVYGAFVAWAQPDLKKLIAYSSVSHMGFVTLGIASLTAEGLNGAMYMMLAHGTISPMLFAVAGVIYDRAHHREIARFGGLAWVMPRYALLASLAIFASLGLPGLSGFVAEVTTFVGAFGGPHRPYAIAALAGVVITAAYYLLTLQRVFLGATPETYRDAAHYPDLTPREGAVLVPLAALTLFMGILPGPTMDLYQGALRELTATLQGALAAVGGAAGGPG